MYNEFIHSEASIEAMKIISDVYGVPTNPHLINYEAYTPKELNYIFDRPDIIEQKENSMICEDVDNCFIYLKTSVRKYRNSTVTFNPNNQHVTSNCTVIAGINIETAMYVPYAEGYPSSYGILISGKWRSIRSDNTKEFSLVIDGNDFENGKIVYKFREKNINAFNLGYKNAQPNLELQIYISDKLNESKHKAVCRPYKAGFFRFGKSELMFITSDYKYGSEATECRSFELKPAVDSGKVLMDFINMVNLHADKCKCVLLCMFRISALLFSIYKKWGYNLNKILVTDREADEYLQVYCRDKRVECYHKIEQSSKNIYNLIFDCKDEVLMLKDNTVDFKNEKITSSQRKNAMLIMNALNEAFNEGKSFSVHRNKHELTDNCECLCSVTGDYAPYYLEAKNRIDVTLDNVEMEQAEIKRINYELDKLIVNNLMNDKNELIRMKITFSSVSNLHKDNDYLVLMATFTYLMNYVFTGIAEFPVSIREFSSYLKELEMYQSNLSDDSYILKQALLNINRVITNHDVQLVNTDKIFTVSTDSSIPVVFYDGEFIYFENKSFSDLISKKIVGRVNELEVKQALQQHHYLCDELSVRKQFSGKGSQTRYTGISVRALEAEALAHLPYRYSNYVPCSNDEVIKRVMLGLDEKDKPLYWSIGHEDMPNLTMLVTGSPKNGKNTFVNLLAMELHSHKNNVIYVDSTGSCTGDELMRTGMSAQYIEDNVVWHDIEPLIKTQDDIGFAWAIQDMIVRRKIIIVTIDENISSVEKKKKIDDLIKILRKYCRMDKEFSVHLVLDEIDTMNIDEDSLIREVILRDRKKGLSLIMIAPQIYSLPIAKRNTILKASMKIYFNIDSESEQKKIAESFNKGNIAKIGGMLGELRKGEFIAHGSFENEDGEVHKRIIKARNNFSPDHNRR